MSRTTYTADAKQIAAELSAQFGFPESLALRATQNMLNGLGFAAAFEKARHDDDALIAELYCNTVGMGRPAGYGDQNRAAVAQERMLERATNHFYANA